MKHIIQLILFCTVGIPAFAARNYSPNTSNSMTGGGSVCQNGTATTVKFKFNNCYNTVGGSGRIAAPITVYWYQNTVNSTSGGTLVSTSTTTTGTSSTKTVTFAPPTTAVGILYYYCIVTWDGTGKCKTTGTLTSSSARSVTVKGSPAAVAGQMALCPSSTVTLTNSVASGTWSSSNLAVASVNSSTGVVSGVTAGTARISYSTGCGTKTYATVTVNSSVAAIAGTLSMCAGSSTTLTNTTVGGTWSSSNAARATVGAATGIVTGVTAGTCTITYSIGCGTPATKVVTVNTQPAAITGTAFACVGSTTALSDVTAGGAWTSSATGVATVNSSGTVTAVSTGTTNISYTLGSCYSMVTVPVRTVPSAISGFSSICTGQPVAFTNTVSGGTWTSSNNAVATVGTSGDVTGIANGNVTISYNTGCGSTVTKAVTVNSSPAAITGSSSICIGGSTTLDEGTGSGDWSSSTPSIATVGSLSGIVTGVAYGTTTITYNEGSCSSTKIVTVNIAPAAITGTALMCEGATTTLANTTNYGTWSSSNTARATVVAGVVTGVGAGTAVISYSTGCGSVATKITTINAQPAAIGGSSEVCATATTTLTNTVPGGAWSSNNTPKATVSSAGVVTGVANGTATISYAIGSCFATTDMTVGTLPNAGTLSGTAAICEEDMTSLATTGDDEGTWTSSNETVATVDISGTVSGNDAGTATISYTVYNTCGSATATKAVTVTVIPAVEGIDGDDNVCIGQTITLSNPVAGGVWTSSNTKATVTSAGVVTGVTSGTANITYTLTNSCGTDYDFQTVTINALPAAIGGTATVCEGATTTLTDATTGGTWSSDNASVATIAAGGVVSGIAAGTVVMTYTSTAGCIATKIVTVNVSPSVLTGTLSMCVGTTVTLDQTVSGGTWASSAATKASVNTTGVVTGVAAGTANISYSIGTCRAIAQVTVNANPAAITGTASVCEGLTTTLADATTGGAWSSSDESTATITGGVVTGIAAGNTNVTYTLGTGCFITKNVTVNTTPAALSGTQTTCIGKTTTLTSATAGGTWASSSTATATVSNGVVTGVAANTATISYTLGSCRTTAVVTVGATPAAIGGTASVCEGSTTALTDATSGGAWSSGNTSVATIATDGTVSGVGAGTSNITYTSALGCIITKVATVNALPAAISGSATACMGSTSTLSNTTPGGAWASGTTAVATIGATGIVTPVSVGNTNISYTLPTGCRSTMVVSVNPLPAAGTITGASSVCEGANTTLNNAVTGGVWSSSNASVASVDASGAVAGVAAGNATISYSVTNSCGTAVATKAIVVNALPNAGSITGASSVCESTTTTFGNAVSGGVWSSSDASVASVTSGVVSGVAAGNATISYSHTTVCGTDVATKAIVVNALPNAGSITGASSVCESATTTLNNAVSGGVWSSSDASVASVTSGVVSGVTAGNATISYSKTTVCGTDIATKAIVVNPLPNAGSITGASSVCESTTTTLGNAVSGGVWSSSDASVASVTSGVVSGVAAGNATISYSKTTVCGTDIATKAIVVNALPNAGSITGASSVCESANTTLNNAVTGGAWSSSDASVASVASGVVSGVAAGNATISYTYTTVCGTDVATKAIVVNPLPNAGSITGASSVCESATTTLNNAVSGGVWSSSDASVASVTSGVVSGVAAGNATISYSHTTVCGTDVATKAILVNALPNAGSITGASSVCESATTTLNNSVSGGAWSSSDASVASVASGVVSGVAAGNATISYSKTTVCGTDVATKAIVVNPLPNAGSITGASSACQNATTALTNAVSGGVWSSSDASVASVSTSGVVDAVAAGNATISYSYSTACGTDVATKAFVVNPLPNAGTITGASSVCQSAATTLANAVTGGVWSSSDASVASVASGVVSGVAAGNATISYSYTTVCGTDVATKAIVVNPLPNAGTITGASSVCESVNTTLSNTVTGGVWSSSDASVASVTSGVVSGVAAGSATISYSYTNVCGTAVATKAIVVNPLSNAGAITGASSVCVSATTTLNNVVTGGVWSSSNTSVATVNTSGIVSGVVAGNATITYTVINGCGTARTTSAIVVNPLASAGSITGTATVLTGSTTALGSTVFGGVWSGSNAAVAVVNGAGVVSGVSGGTACITYTVSNSCGPVSTIRIVTVNSLSSISGTLTVCGGFTTTLSNSTIGGTWSSSTPSVASVGSSTGIVSGVASGTSTITYMVSGNYVTAVVTVNTVAPAITGTARTCVGTTTTLDNNVPGGVWSSANAAIASVGSSTGIVTGGATAGVATITYALGGSCRATVVVTNNAIPTSTGAGVVCVGTNATLTGSPAGGAWTSDDATIASIASNGIITGVSAGTTVMTYTAATGCVKTVNATVNVTPTAITGTRVVCSGSTTTLENTVDGGVWSSGSTAYAVANATTGVITGSSFAGAVTISYTIGSCRATTTITNNALPTVTASGVVCVGTNVTLTGSPAGGTWSSNDETIASIASNGIITGVSAGTTQMTYTLATGCYKTANATVNVTPTAITGTRVVCSGATTTLENTVAGGVWSTGSTVYAIANASTGVITGGASAGVVNVSYTLGSCRAIATFTNNALPTITGSAITCVGTSATLTGAPAGGTWSSNDETIASIATNGVVTGATAGTIAMTYTLGTGCARAAVATVNITPEAISGTASVCQGTTTTLSNDVAGGVWSSANVNVATIVSTTGVVTGVSAGTVLISYTKGTCRATKIVTVMGLPAVTGGVLKACPGTTTVLTNTTPGGVWSSANTSIAIVDPFDGTVTGVAPGTVLMSFTMPSGCARTAIVTINSTPADVIGNREVCPGSTTALTGSGVTLSWTSSNTAVATVGATGIVTGVAAGTTDITFKVNTGCYTVATVTVNPLPSTFTGVMKACPGTTTSLGNAIDGGTWTSSNNTVATIDADGVMSGLIVGTTNITYALPTGCRRIAAATVNPLPGAITGHAITCVGTHTTLSATGGTGTWSSTDASIATVATPASGIATGISAGTTDITFTLASGCYSTAQMTVTPIPDGIIGSVAVCSGLSTALDNATVGGTWASSNATVASVNMNTGVVTAVNAGTALISYCLGANCRITTSFTVKALPALIGGSTAACVGATTTLSNTTTGGVWESENTSVATISGTGVVSGIDAGTAGISYTGTNGCTRTGSVSVFPVPSAITGTNVIDAGEQTTLSNTVPGGTWSGPVSNVLSVDAGTGIVTGRNLGAATVSYTTGGNCRATYVVSVNGIAGLWIGASNTSWSNSANWYGGVLPTDALDVVIPAGTPYAPTVASGVASAKELNVNSGATVTIAGGAELDVKGGLVNNGTVTGAGELKLNGTASQVLTGRGNVYNITLDNSTGAVVSAAGSDTLKVCGTLLLNNGTLTTNNRAMLVSNATGSGRIGTITGGAITGNVIVQQYVPGRRAWRMMGHPFSTPVALNQLTPYIDVTGVGGGSNGFTTTATNETSCFWFNQYISAGVFNSGTDPGWVAFTSTNGATSANQVNQYEGIRIFIRGSKGQGLTSAGYTPSATTIRMQGAVNTGDQTMVMHKGSGTDASSGLPTQDFNLLSNPYPSAVDLGTVLKNAYDAGAIRGSSFWVWDPFLGTNGQSVAVPIDGTPYYLPANAAFIVRVNNDGDVLNFTEAHKSATASASLLKTKSDYLTLKIYDESYHPWDMLNVRFSESATNSEDMQDAVKPSNLADLDFYSVSEKNTKLSVDARPYKAGKVVPLGIKSNYAQEFIIRAENVAVPQGGKVYLQDKFLNKRVQLLAGTEYRFEVTADDKTQGDKRFELQMDPTEVVETAITAKPMTVSISPNPATDLVTVNYTTAGKDEVNVSVMSVAGEVIMNRDFGAQKAGKINMTLKDLPSGVYMITVKSGAETSTQRLIKE